MTRRLTWPLIIVVVITLFPLPTTAAPAHQQAPCAEVYTVQASDWLSKIADKFLGDRRAFPAIVAATNKLQETDKTFALIAFRLA